jgi:hypothetical protein
MRTALPTAALVELHNEVAIGVEVTPTAGAAAGAGATVDHQRGLAVPVAACLPVDEVVICHLEEPLRERLHRRIWLHAAQRSPQSPHRQGLAPGRRPGGVGYYRYSVVTEDIATKPNVTCD